MKRSTLILVALTLLFGAQSLRVLLPSLVWHWGATLGMGAGQVALYAYAPVGSVLAAPLLVRWLKPRGALWVAGGGLMLCRLVEQVSTTINVDVWAALGGSGCFLALLPLLYGRARADSEPGLRSFALGLLLGMSVDTALRGLTGTLELSWIPGAWPRLTIIALVGAFGVALWRATAHDIRLEGESFLASLPLIGFGPLLFAEWQILQNQGWVATLTGWPPGMALGWIVLGNVGALLAADNALTKIRRHSRRWRLLAGGTLTLALLFAEVPGWIFALGVLVGLVSAGLLVAVIAGEGRQPVSRAGIFYASLTFWLGLLLFNTLVALYYMSFIVRLPPFPRSALAPVAAGVATLCSLGAAWLRPYGRAAQAPDWAFARLSALMLFVPLSVFVAEALPGAKPLPAAGDSVRVMTYNIRSAYGMEGRQDVEAIAQVIEDAGTEVVALQELSRGWFLNGGTDLLPLLSRRLNMPYTVMGAATDPLFGNAILSRYPISASGQGNLPRLDTLIGRGYVWAQIDPGGGNKLLVMTTHLETQKERTDVRMAQVQTVFNAWKGQPQTVLLGDMNAGPGSPEIQMILDAGLVDAWTEAGHSAEFTWMARRIDWIFHTPDLIARDVSVIESRASDHFAVVATIQPRP